MSRAIGFQTKLRNFQRSSQAAVTSVRLIAQREIARSIRRGSEITGAPGQPVQTGNLLASWVESRPSADVWEFSTPVEYAVWIEDGGNDISAFTLRSEVGGFHSVKLTQAAWPDIVAFARAETRRRGFVL